VQLHKFAHLPALREDKKGQAFLVRFAGHQTIKNIAFIACKPACLGYCHLAVNRLLSGMHLTMMQNHWLLHEKPLSVTHSGA